MKTMKEKPLTKTELNILTRLTDEFQFFTQRETWSAYKLADRKFATFQIGVAKRDNVKGETTLAPAFKITDDGKAFFRKLAKAKGGAS